jgi:hypothetical protein
MSPVSLNISSLQPYAKLLGVVAAVILLGAWLIEKTFLEHANQLRDATAKAEQDKEATERSFRTESRLTEVYQVAASARDYSYRGTLKDRATYVDRLIEDVETLERTGVARNFASSLVAYSSRTTNFLNVIDPPRPIRDRVTKASKSVSDFQLAVDQRYEQYMQQQRRLVGEVINPNTITEQQATELSTDIRALRNDVEFTLMPRFAPLANELFRAYDELFNYAGNELREGEKRASMLRWVQFAVFAAGSIIAILGSYLEITKPSHT